MSSLSQRLHLGVSQKQILTPGLVQMVTVLQLNRMELKDMITNEIAENPVLEEAAEAGEELTPGEVQSLLERERVADPADQAMHVQTESTESAQSFESFEPSGADSSDPAVTAPTIEEPVKSETDPFDEIDFGSFFDDYLDPGFKSPASESVEKPSFETFLSAPMTLGDHLRSQLSVSLIPEEIRDAAESIIGNLDEDGYLSASLDEIAAAGEHQPEHVEESLRVVQSLDPAGVGARDLRECLLLQIESVNGRGGVAWQIVSSYLRLLETKQFK